MILKVNLKIRQDVCTRQQYIKSTMFLKDSLSYFQKESQKELRLGDELEEFIFALFEYEKKRSGLDYLTMDMSKNLSIAEVDNNTDTKRPYVMYTVKEESVEHEQESPPNYSDEIIEAKSGINFSDEDYTGAGEPYVGTSSGELESTFREFEENIDERKNRAKSDSSIIENNSDLIEGIVDAEEVTRKEEQRTLKKSKIANISLDKVSSLKDTNQLDRGSDDAQEEMEDAYYEVDVKKTLVRDNFTQTEESLDIDDQKIKNSITNQNQKKLVKISEKEDCFNQNDFFLKEDFDPYHHPDKIQIQGNNSEVSANLFEDVDGYLETPRLQVDSQNHVILDVDRTADPSPLKIVQVDINNSGKSSRKSSAPYNNCLEDYLELINNSTEMSHIEGEQFNTLSDIRTRTNDERGKVDDDNSFIQIGEMSNKDIQQPVKNENDILLSHQIEQRNQIFSQTDRNDYIKTLPASPVKERNERTKSGDFSSVPNYNPRNGREQLGNRSDLIDSIRISTEGAFENEQTSDLKKTLNQGLLRRSKKPKTTAADKKKLEKLKQKLSEKYQNSKKKVRQKFRKTSPKNQKKLTLKKYFKMRKSHSPSARKKLYERSSINNQSGKRDLSDDRLKSALDKKRLDSRKKNQHYIFLTERLNINQRKGSLAPDSRTERLTPSKSSKIAVVKVESTFRNFLLAKQRRVSSNARKSNSFDQSPDPAFDKDHKSLDHSREKRKLKKIDIGDIKRSIESYKNKSISHLSNSVIRSPNSSHSSCEKEAAYIQKVRGNLKILKTVKQVEEEQSQSLLKFLPMGNKNSSQLFSKIMKSKMNSFASSNYKSPARKSKRALKHKTTKMLRKKIKPKEAQYSATRTLKFSNSRVSPNRQLKLLLGPMRGGGTGGSGCRRKLKTVKNSQKKLEEDPNHHYKVQYLSPKRSLRTSFYKQRKSEEVAVTPGGDLSSGPTRIKTHSTRMIDYAGAEKRSEQKLKLDKNSFLKKRRQGVVSAKNSSYSLVKSYLSSQNNPELSSNTSTHSSGFRKLKKRARVKIMSKKKPSRIDSKLCRLSPSQNSKPVISHAKKRLSLRDKIFDKKGSNKKVVVKGLRTPKTMNFNHKIKINQKKKSSSHLERKVKGMKKLKSTEKSANSQLADRIMDLIEEFQYNRVDLNKQK